MTLVFSPSERGQDIVEYALILPLLLLLLFGIVDFGVVFMRYVTVANAAREGARAAMLPVNEACGWETCRRPNAELAAQQLTAGLDPAQLRITVPPPVGGSVRVNVTYTSTLMTGIIINALGGQDEIVLRSTASMQAE